MTHTVNASFVSRRDRLARRGQPTDMTVAAGRVIGRIAAVVPGRPAAAAAVGAPPEPASREPAEVVAAASDETRSSSFASQLAMPALAVYVVTLVLRPQDWFPAIGALYIEWIVFAVLLLLTAFRLGRVQSHLVRAVPVWLMLVWLAVIVASDVVHGDLWQAKTALIVYARIVIIFVDIVLFVENDRQVRFLIWEAIALSALLVWQSIDMVRTGVGWAGQPLGWNDGFGGRVLWIGLWNGPDVLCLLFVIFVPFLAEFLFKPWGWMARFAAAPLIPVMVYGVYLTQSRGGFLAMAAGVALWVFGRFKTSRALAFGVVFAVALATAAPGRMAKLDDRDTSRSSYNRVEMWQAGVTMLRDNPLLGVGKMRFTQFGKAETGHDLLAHNTFVENMAETGLVGLFVFIGLFYVSIKGLCQVKKNETDLRVRGTANALLASLCTYIVAVMFITTEFDLMYVLLALVGAFLVARPMGSSEDAANRPSWTRLTIRDVAAIAGIEVAFVTGLYLFVRVYL